MTKTSAAGALALLDESNVVIQGYALDQLNSLVEVFWPEIADHLAKIESISETKEHPSHELASLVASKVYYNLSEYSLALSHALSAGALFDLSLRTPFVSTLVSKCIDTYIQTRTSTSPSPTPDPRLESIVERMFTQCFKDSEFSQAVGIALETRRLDVVEKAIGLGNARGLLKYVLERCASSVEHLEFRKEVLRLLSRMYQNLPEPDYFSMMQCQTQLEDAPGTVELLTRLVAQGGNQTLIALQICFDLQGTATQEFLQRVVAGLPEAPTLLVDAMQTATETTTDTAADSAVAATTPETTTDTAADSAVAATTPETTTDTAADSAVAATPPETTTETATGTKLATTAETAVTPVEISPFTKIRRILSGELSIALTLRFLSTSNQADLLYLKKSKLLESKNSMYHSAITFSNALMNAGTTSDEFLRDNLSWLALANNWAKFSATAALGVIHRIEHGMTLLGPYLPRDGVAGSPYSEGGALYALGLIHTSHGAAVLPFLTTALKATQNEIVQHGACLGLGIAGIATDSPDLYANIKEVLFTDNATSGEAAGLAMGLVMLGTKNLDAVAEMLQYAHDTKHEKIIRGLALGVAMIVYGKEDQADSVIAQMTSDQDALIRYGGMYALAMAYAGTASNSAIRRVLHFAVSDVNDDVRRAAVTALGFLLYRTPEKVPKLVQLLSESYNPFVRYGATQALGIACAGTGLQTAVDILIPLTKDNVGFVKQGALIALGMVYIQHNATQSPGVTLARDTFDRIITDRYEDQPSKFGATLAQGIIDAGGRNVTISLGTSHAAPNMRAIVGMALFTQTWFWFPLTHALSLAFTPTAFIGLDSDLEMEFVSGVRASMFAYPERTVVQTVETVEMVATAVLSTTAKALARSKRKDGDATEMDLTPVVEAAVPTALIQEKPEPKKKKEESTQVLGNMTRITPMQQQYVRFVEGVRYVPVKRGAVSGIVVMADSMSAMKRSGTGKDGAKENVQGDAMVE